MEWSGVEWCGVEWSGVKDSGPCIVLISHNSVVFKFSLYSVLPWATPRVTAVRNIFIMWNCWTALILYFQNIRHNLQSSGVKVSNFRQSQTWWKLGFGGRHTKVHNLSMSQNPSSIRIDFHMYFEMLILNALSVSQSLIISVILVQFLVRNCAILGSILLNPDHDWKYGWKVE